MTASAYAPPPEFPWMSRAYPFWSIAQHYGLPYGDVLYVSSRFDQATDQRTNPGAVWTAAVRVSKMPHVAVHAIQIASRRERGRREGKLGSMEDGR